MVVGGLDYGFRDPMHNNRLQNGVAKGFRIVPG